MPKECGKTLDFLRSLLVLLPLAIHKSLKALLLVHPSLSLRLAFAIVAVPLWGKLKVVDHLRQLHALWPPGTLLVPEEIAQEDDRRTALVGAPFLKLLMRQHATLDRIGQRASPSAALHGARAGRVGMPHDEPPPPRRAPSPSKTAGGVMGPGSTAEATLAWDHEERVAVLRAPEVD
jgi:hypothetical protein